MSDGAPPLRSPTGQSALAHPPTPAPPVVSVILP